MRLGARSGSSPVGTPFNNGHRCPVAFVSVPQTISGAIDRVGSLAAALTTVDLDRLDPNLRLRPPQIDMQQAIVKPGAFHLNPFGKHKGALELPGGNATMQEDPTFRIVPLAATDNQLVILLRDLQVIHRETRDSEGDPQPVLGGLLDVVGGVAVRVLGDPVEHLLKMIEAEEQRRAEYRWTRQEWPPHPERSVRPDPKHPTEPVILSGKPRDARGNRCKGVPAGLHGRSAMTDPETLPILLVPDPRLRAKARPVGPADADRIRELAPRMLDAMYKAPGIGLAAPQVGVGLRLIVVDLQREDKPEPLVLVNPQILIASTEMATREEGCLSLPGQYADVTRPAQVKLRYLDLTGAKREIEADGLLATCLQHEVDHLDGVLFVDHLSALKRNMLLRKLAKDLKARVRD